MYLCLAHKRAKKNQVEIPDLDFKIIKGWTPKDITLCLATTKVQKLLIKSKSFSA